MTTSFPTFLRVTAVVFGALLTFVASVNYYFDPANLFNDRTYEAGIAQMLLDGRNVANITDYDERLLQKFYVSGLPQAKEVLVLGSSRAMNIGENLFPGKSFFNASVSSASLEDDEAILQMYRERGLLPKKLVLGVDPWIFNRKSGQTRWKSLSEEYKRSQCLSTDCAVSNWDPEYLRWSKFQQLISFSYLRASLKAAREKRRGYYATDALELDVNIRGADGTIRYRTAFVNQTSDEVAAVVQRHVAGKSIYSLDDFRQLDPEYSAQFDALLTRLKQEHIEVLLVLSPYQYDMFKFLTAANSGFEMVVSAERMVRKLASKHGMTVLGSYDPQNVDCGRNDFYDEMHPRPSCIEKMFKNSTF